MLMLMQTREILWETQAVHSRDLGDVLDYAIQSTVCIFLRSRLKKILIWQSGWHFYTLKIKYSF